MWKLDATEGRPGASKMQIGFRPGILCPERLGPVRIIKGKTRN